MGPEIECPFFACFAGLAAFFLRGLPKGWFSKRVVLADVPSNENQNEGTFGCCPGTKAGSSYLRMFPQNNNTERGHVRQTTLLRNRPFVSS